MIIIIINLRHCTRSFELIPHLSREHNIITRASVMQYVSFAFDLCVEHSVAYDVNQKIIQRAKLYYRIIIVFPNNIYNYIIIIIVIISIFCQTHTAHIIPNDCSHDCVPQ